MAKQATPIWHMAALVLAFVLAPTAAQAQTAAPLPANSARCVYDYMSDEDREMALLLFASEAISGGRFRKGSKNVLVVDRLIDEAHEKCLDRFAWSIGRSDAAKSYALTAILGEGLRQVLELEGFPIAKIDAYFAANRTVLSRKNEVEGADKDRFTGWMIKQGWDAEKADALNLATLYLETRILLDRTERFFGYSGGTGRQSVKARPSPARKARRGRP